MMNLQEIVKDWYIKGLQISRCYEEEWDEIQKTFSKYNLSINQHGPVLTTNALKDIRIVDNITRHVSRSGYVELTDKNIFLLLLRSYPIYSRLISERSFRNMVYNNNPSLLHELSKIQGTLKETQSLFEQEMKKCVPKINLSVHYVKTKPTNNTGKSRKYNNR